MREIPFKAIERIAAIACMCVSEFAFEVVINFSENHRSGLVFFLLLRPPIPHYRRVFCFFILKHKIYFTCEFTLEIVPEILTSLITLGGF